MLMEDYMQIIKRVIEEHEDIKLRVKLLGKTISDREALMTLDKVSTVLVPEEGHLAELRDAVLPELSRLEEGLNNHYAFEERNLPTILGELLMRGLCLEHDELRKQLTYVKSIIRESQLEGLSREELIAKGSEMHDEIYKYLSHKEEHLASEDGMFRLLEKIMEQES